MQGFRHFTSQFLGARTLRLAALLAIALASAAGAEVGSDASAPGAYCEIGQCRPVAASAWTPIAFAITVFVIGRTARRGDEPS